DSSGNLWMFGGYSNTTNFDLWKFDLVTTNWVCWGSYYLGTASNNGILCTDSAVNWPTSRSETNFSWNDAGNHLWLFGGFGFSLMNNNFSAHDDLWKYDFSSNKWVRVFGKDYYTGGFYGQQGISSSFNYPFARYGGISFQDTSGNFWLFGGIYSLHPNSQTDCFNDLWRYVPDSTCGVYTEVNEVAQQENQIEIYPNPVSDVLHVKYSSPEKTTITVFNHLGEVVMKKNLEGTKEMNVSLLPQGIYLITIRTDGNCYSRKLVITK
ncbi:MAG: T9SS type A sorting domain-containing protein, partial [Chitinophagales bacterium]